jgi:hypothetical protein
MTDLRIDVDDPEVLELLDQAVARKPLDPKPRIRIFCDQCSRKMADVWSTQFGPLFLSHWELEDRLMFDVRDAHGSQIPERQAIKVLTERENVTIESSNTKDLHAVVALLDLPAELAQDYPDLLVRCSTHGDAVLDRMAIARWWAEKSRVSVSVNKPHRTYRTPRRTYVTGITNDA